MTKSTYVFEAFDKAGNPVRRLSQRCTNLRARDRAEGLLKTIPEAAVVYGVEAHGRAVHAAYRS